MIDGDDDDGVVKHNCSIYVIYSNVTLWLAQKVIAGSHVYG